METTIDNLATDAQQAQLAALVGVLLPYTAELLTKLEYPHLECVVEDQAGVAFTLTVRHVNRIRIPRVLCQTMPLVFKDALAKKVGAHVDLKKNTLLPIEVVVATDQTSIKWVIACIRAESTW